MSTFLFEQLPIDVVGAEHSSVSLLSILESALGPDLGGYSGFWIADAGTDWLSTDDFNYWNPAAPDPTSFTVNGTAITQSSAYDFQQTYLTAAQLSSCKIVIGNEIAPLNFVTVDITNGGAYQEYIQFELNIVDPSLQRTTTSLPPTPSDIVAAAQRFASAYSGVLNDNDCHFIAGDVAAAAGATFDNEETGSLVPSQNESSGFWRVVYRGSDPGSVSNWQTLVRPGDIVRMGWAGGGQHTTVVLGVNADGSINVFDNADSNALGQEDIGIHTVNYDTETSPQTVTIFRLTNDGYYLINSDNNNEILNGSQFNNEFNCGSGNDIVNCGPGHDLVNVGAGTKTVNGGGGFDTVSIPVSFTAASVTDTHGNPLEVIDGYTIDSSGAAIRVSWSGGEDTLNGVSAVQFADRLLAVDTPTTGSILLQSAGGQAALWGMKGTSVIAGGIVSANPGPSWRAVGTGDFNDDGLPDILWQNTNGQAAIWDMNGLSLIGGGTAGPNPGPSWHAVGTGDFNDDGHSDILWQNANGQAAVWDMNGTAIIGGGTTPNPGPSWKAIGTGDFNDDGHSDILWQNSSGQAAIWEMNGNAIVGGGMAGPNPGPSWKLIGSGDFNDDGHSDLLWQNAGGQVAIWEMKGASIVGGGTVSANPGPSWHAIGTGDFNGDGHSDILFQSASGQPAVWDMNGASIVGGGAVSANPGPSWRAVGLV